jgi:MoaA/NifB/PqqE/SkfB family radical SAM enzyme
MKDLFIDEVAKIKAFETLGRPLYMPDELVFLDFDRSLDRTLITNAFQLYAKDGSNLWLKCEDGEDLSHLDNYLKGYVLKISEYSNTKKLHQYVELQLSENNIDSFELLAKDQLLNVKTLFLNPRQLSFEHLGRIQNLLTTLSSKGFHVDFTHNHELYYQWDAKTLNTSRGPLQVDIDLSNGCTHNCQFCGLYADSVIERQKNQNKGELPSEVISLQKAKISEDKALKIIEDLPDTLERVILGGAGDPYTHGKINQVIKTLRNKGVSVQIFTNFSYLSKKDIETLHSLCLDDKESLSFIINLSGATPETYIKTRPNQNEGTFQKVTDSIKYASELIKKDGKGLYMTLMSVTTSDNYHEMPSFISMSKSLGCDRVWIKPLEPHDEESFKILVKEEHSLDYAVKAKQSLYLADKMGVEIVEREILERIVENYCNKIAEYEKTKSINSQIKELSAHCHWTLECLTTSELKPIKSYRVSYGNIFDVAPDNRSPYEINDWKLRFEQTYWHEKIETSQQDFSTEAGFSNDVFDSQPCYIGHAYMRIHVDGKVTPCCNLDLEIGSIQKNSSQRIWNGSEMNTFRSKMLEMPFKRFHRTESQYSICARCPHLKFNRLYHQFKTRNS